MTTHAHHGPPSAPSAVAVTPPATAKAPEVSSWKLLATLAIGGAAAGLLVVAVYRATLPTIEKYAAAKEAGAVREVLKAPARWDTLYLQKGVLTKSPDGGEDRKRLPKAYLGFDATGNRLGAAVTAQEPGFQEEVLLMIGFEPSNGTLIGFKVLEQKETPGLGDKIERDTSFVSQFAERIPPLKGVKKADASNLSQVQTITGATISSRAVIRIINHAVERWQPLLAAYEKGGTQ
ncbi:MAG TPA: RnfABCDGE type electron transport complex subunit G [Gemmatimonadaceae bacterium]|nr:RnfABCDGE type electron transport complex subunit G [Gemmatimonadaceae bacterium]